MKISEFIQKVSLKEQIELNRFSARIIQRDMPPFIGIASAMAYLHSHKIIHRDLKLGNILMDDDLYLKITVFLLSKIQIVFLINPQLNPNKQFFIHGLKYYIKMNILV